MFAQQFVFKDFHFDYVNRVFGQEGKDLLTRIPAYATDGRSHVHMGDDFVHLMLRGDDFTDAFVFIHEFGHIWHAVKHPDLSAVATEARCEAAAYECETRLAQGSPAFAELLVQRSTMYWRPDARQIVRRVPDSVPIKVAIPQILRGIHG